MSESPTTPLQDALRQSLLPRLGRAFLFLLLTGLVVVGGWEGYRSVKLHLALTRARREFSNRQFMRAEFWAGRVFAVDGKNVEATRLMAGIKEAQDRPEALRWRIRAAQLEPGNGGDILAWAKCAFRFGQREMATSALHSLPIDFQNRSADYHELEAGCALDRHETSLAEMHFAKAAELDHDNPVHRVNLAGFRLTNSSNPETRAAAARDLEGMLADPRARLFAARALLTDAQWKQDHARAQHYAEKLHAIPEHHFEDDLTCLGVSISDPTAFRPALAAIEQRAGSDASRATETENWLNTHGMAGETLYWSAHLSQPVQANVRVQIAVAEAHLAMSDWSGLESFLVKCHWDEGDFLRRAMLVLGKRELSQPWEKEWNQLVADADANPPDGYLLAQVAVGWNWRDQALTLLWGATKRPETGAAALQKLWDIYSLSNQTRELWRVARAQIELEPANPTRKNNEAFLSLLLFGASERAERLAREASATNPKVPEWAMTYAYALHLAGKDAAAKKVVENLSPETLGRPGVALYSAIIMEATGDSAQAKETLAKLNVRGMLPEERKLAVTLAQKLNIAIR